VASSRSPCGPGKFALCRLSEFRNSAPVIAVILRRVRQVARVLEQSIQPSQAGHFDEELGVMRWQGPVSHPEIFAARYIDHDGR
jgi:hypothetical protein